MRAASRARTRNLWDSTVGDNLKAFRVHAHQWWEGPTFLPEPRAPVIEECRAHRRRRSAVEPATTPLLPS